MSTFTQILYQIVFSTKKRNPCLIKKNREKLYRHMWGTLRNKKCHLYRINGIEDHIHIVTHLNPTIALSSLVKDLKLSSSSFIKRKHLFPSFDGWQNGYAAFTYGISEKDRLIDYVKNQEAHHKQMTFKEELIQLLKENEINYDEKYLL